MIKTNSSVFVKIKLSFSRPLHLNKLNPNRYVYLSVPKVITHKIHVVFRAKINKIVWNVLLNLTVSNVLTLRWLSIKVFVLLNVHLLFIETLILKSVYLVLNRDAYNVYLRLSVQLV